MYALGNHRQIWHKKGKRTAEKGEFCQSNHKGAIIWWKKAPLWLNGFDHRNKYSIAIGIKIAREAWKQGNNTSSHNGRNFLPLQRDERFHGCRNFYVWN